LENFEIKHSQNSG